MLVTVGDDVYTNVEAVIIKEQRVYILHPVDVDPPSHTVERDGRSVVVTS